jgi:hypothetical protein
VQRLAGGLHPQLKCDLTLSSPDSITTLDGPSSENRGSSGRAVAVADLAVPSNVVPLKICATIVTFQRLVAQTVSKPVERK